MHFEKRNNRNFHFKRKAPFSQQGRNELCIWAPRKSLRCSCKTQSSRLPARTWLVRGSFLLSCSLPHGSAKHEQQRKINHIRSYKWVNKVTKGASVYSYLVFHFLLFHEQSNHRKIIEQNFLLKITNPSAKCVSEATRLKWFAKRNYLLGETFRVICLWSERWCRHRLFPGGKYTDSQTLAACSEKCSVDRAKPTRLLPSLKHQSLSQHLLPQHIFTYNTARVRQTPTVFEGLPPNDTRRQW